MHVRRDLSLLALRARENAELLGAAVEPRGIVSNCDKSSPASSAECELGRVDESEVQHCFEFLSVRVILGTTL
jgi:hypothetical protein